MTIDDYLVALDAKLQEIAGLVSASTIQRELDANRLLTVRLINTSHSGF